MQLAFTSGWLIKLTGTNRRVDMVLSGKAGFASCYSSLYSPFIEPLLGTNYEGYPVGSSES